ncbi:AraC family transcriptional regulator [Acinetobacter larvae]|uniref:AraC family transcriptional regulator n=1 Tax=Acinetobacter larvae TaxID=1789224 RepID=A0A1B2LYB8_9GAMM|nr:helix-turn-helix transcriptional regulator [Acinetobacter larvae]AOA57926.1 AraC family transcriptional regulator [Acinetobacter larvae]
MTKRLALNLSINSFDPDDYPQPAVALRLEVADNHVEQPLHRHRKGQLILAMHGGVTCEVSQAMWMVPPHHAVWIPSGMLHSNRATDNAQIYFLFIEPDVIEMPEQCCTLAMNPLVCAMIEYLAQQDPDYDLESATGRLVMVLLEQLPSKPIAQLHLPISSHAKIGYIAARLIADPSDRTTLADWASQLAMSERTLARLIHQETGLTFGRWRQQLHLIIALRQLSNGLSVQHVAGNLGYDSVTAFITMFKKALGQSPTQYFAALQK